jgi:hypothetical protein
LQHGDKTIIKYNDQVKYQAIAKAIRTHPEIAGYMRGALTEQTFIAKDPETGVMVRCRADLVNTIADYTVCIDLKSCEDARSRPFRRACQTYGYFHQDAFYRDVIEWSGCGKVDLFLFAAFEKEPPYAVRLYQSSEAAISRARETYRRNLNIAAECLERGVWPSYDTDIEALDYIWAEGCMVIKQ